MSKELEALEKIKNSRMIEQYKIVSSRFGNRFTCCTIDDIFSDEIKIIETALKRYDTLEFIAVDIEQDNKALIKENNKLKRALEIIKELILNDLVFGGKEHSIKFSFGPYTLYTVIKDKTKFDLLKEILCEK